MKKALSIGLRLLISAVLIFLVFWFTLPPLNIRSAEFWSFLSFSLLILILVNFTGKVISFVQKVSNGAKGRGAAREAKAALKALGYPMMGLVGLLVLLGVFSVIFNVIGAEIFNASSYNQLIVMKDADFSEDVAELNMSQIPIVDRNSSMLLGKRKLGEMSDLVSQFEIAEDYTQINYNDVPTRVTPLLYGDVIKWLNNQSEGIPGYLRVNITTQDVTLVRLEDGIRYSESEYFMRYIHRWIRFNYPT